MNHCLIKSFLSSFFIFFMLIFFLISSFIMPGFTHICPGHFHETSEPVNQCSNNNQSDTHKSGSSKCNIKDISVPQAIFNIIPLFNKSVYCVSYVYSPESGIKGHLNTAGFYRDMPLKTIGMFSPVSLKNIIII
jgi:hypothetical protein